MLFSLIYAAYRTCSSPPGQAVVLRACDGVRGATAAPWPASGAQLTGHAWPAGGGLRTWAVADLLVDPEGMEYLEKAQTKDLIRQSGRAQIDRLDAILLLMRDDVGRELTEDWVAQHLMFMRLAEERVGDGAGRVREAGQVRSSCQGIYCQGMAPSTWRTHKTFTTTFWASESEVQGTLISR